MENAVKALYMAAGVLIGIMILSLAVVLFSSLQGYMEETNKQIMFNEVTRFNAKYTKYVDTELTIQDIITVAGEAYENNKSYNIDPNAWNESSNSLYIAIYLENNGRIDQKMGENGEMVELLGNNNASVQKYKCANSDVEYSENTGKIFKMTFRVEP
ncbi:MAG: hypothetical protein V8R51_08065 [Clostridia bacterium]